MNITESLKGLEEIPGPRDVLITVSSEEFLNIAGNTELKSKLCNSHRKSISGVGGNTLTYKIGSIYLHFKIDTELKNG